MVSFLSMSFEQILMRNFFLIENLMLNIILFEFFYDCYIVEEVYLFFIYLKYNLSRKKKTKYISKLLM
jgi:hypothetical protein